MRIEFDPTNPNEAAAVRAMLTAMVNHTTDMSALPEGDDRRWAEPVQPTSDTIFVPYHERADNEIPAPDVDRDNEPHDPRIHSTPPKLNADGTWRAKRGVKAEEIAAVRAEREMAQHEANLTEEVEQEQPVTVPLAEPAVSAPATPPAPPASEPSSTPTPAPTPPAPTAPVGTSAPSFLDVMKAITAAQKDGKIDTAKVKELCAAVGAGESTMGLNGPDNGDKRVAFMALLASETEGK